MTSDVAVIYRCVKCGKATNWEEALGPEPLCIKCWDKEVELFYEAKLSEEEHSHEYQLAYDGDIDEHPKPYVWVLDEYLKELGLKYYRAHKEKCLAYMREYYLAHKAELNQYRLNYYHTHKEAFLSYQHKYRLAHKAEQLEYERKYRLTHKAEKKAYNHKYYLAHKAGTKEYYRAHPAEKSLKDISLPSKSELYLMKRFATKVVARMNNTIGREQ